MKNDPILASTAWREENHRYSMKVFGGLRYIRGNRQPHFTITADIREDGREYTCGCCHDEIEKRFPGRFTDLIAMHLSDLDGTPMHFEANGWYTLAGVLGGAGERYHAGNQQYLDTSPEALLHSFAEHCRITLPEAQAIADNVRLAFGPKNESYAFGPHSPNDYKRGREVWKAWAAKQIQRMQAEANSCIEKHKLVIFGDKWEGVAA